MEFFNSAVDVLQTLVTVSYTHLGKALENQEKGFIRIRNHAKVRGGDLLYDRRDREL